MSPSNAYHSRKAIIGTSNYWFSPFQVGMHQIARCLAQEGWQIAFISAPISPLHILNSSQNHLKERAAFYQNNGLFDLEKKIWSYVPGAWLTHNNQPILRTEWMLHNWHKFAFPNVSRLLVDNGFESVDLIMVDFIDNAPLLESIPHSASVYRVADNNLGFKDFTPAERKYEQEYASRADLVIYSARNLEAYVENLNPRKSLYFPNGVNFEHFQGDWEVPVEFQSISRPIALYIGALNYWFDYELLEKTAQEMPGVSFVLVGPDRLAREKIKQLPNLFMLGSKKYADLPPYLHHADVGIIPFDLNHYPDLVNSINPLKLYEYMACHLPVVASAWEELRQLNSPAFLYSTPEEFKSALQKALHLPDAEKEICWNYARQQNWSNRIKILLETIEL